MNTEEIKQVVLRYTEAIHTQNKEDFYALWANNNDCVLISITKQFQGIDSIYEDFLIGGIQAGFSTIKLVAESIDVHEISETLATVVFQYHTECILRESGEPFGIAGLETQVLVKEDGQWKLQHVHYSK